MNIIGEKDPDLWRIAKKRAAFKKHLFSYIVVNGMLWCIWAFQHKPWHGGFPWPAWVSLFWGIGLLFNYYEAFHGNDYDMAEHEYEKLKKERERKNSL